MGTSAYWQQTGLNAHAQGAIAEARGGSFKDGATSSVIGGLAASGAGIVGDTNAPPLANIAAHAVLGCAVAAAGNKDCAAGAIGGAASATLARIIDSAISDAGLGKDTQKAIIAGGSVAGSIAIAAALGKDQMTAGNAAANEVLNNYLDHDEEAKRQAAVEKQRRCEGVKACAEATAELKYWNDLDASRNVQIATACRNPTSSGCLGLNAALQKAARSYDNYDPKTNTNGLINGARDRLLAQADYYQQVVDHPYGIGVGTGLFKLTPPVALAGLGVAAYDLTTAINTEGGSKTADAIGKGAAALWDNLVAGLSSSDPAVRGEAQVNAVALITLPAALAKGLIPSGAGLAKVGVAESRAGGAAVEAAVGTKGALPVEIVKLAEANISTTGETVLGSFPGYINKAQTRGASYFDIGSAWTDQLTNDAQRWAANSHFLDVIAAKGDQVYLSISKTSIQPGTWLAREGEYLTTQKGYTWINQWSLKKVQ